jgi:hypothetical protein
MPLHHRGVLYSVLLLTVVSVGCIPMTGPAASLEDPATTAAQAAALDSALSSPVVASFQSLGGQIHLAPPVNGAIGALGALSLAQPGRDRYEALARQAQALKQVVPAFASLAASTIIPDTLKGSVFTWNTSTSRYARSATTGGPVNGVRFGLYATAPGAHAPSLPLVQVGYADLLDLSSGGWATLQIIVKNTAGSITFLDYTFSGSGSSSSFSAAVSGMVTNGLAGAANKTLTFSIAISGSTNSVSLTLSSSLNNPAVTVQESLTIADDGLTTTLTIDFTFTRPGESVRLAGTVARSNSDGSATINITITVNGGMFATVKGTSGQLVIARSAGGQVTADELAAITYLLLAAADVSEKVTALFEPARRSLGF